MKKEILQKTRESRVKSFIERYKFLSDKKYFKDIRVSVAAYDSWAALGSAGSCEISGTSHYFYGFQHKRFTTKSGQKSHEAHWNSWGKICSPCYDEIEKQCDYKFIKF